jgi:hypothetical protein
VQRFRSPQVLLFRGRNARCLSIAGVEDPDGNPIQLVQPREPGGGGAPEPAV